MSEENKPTVPRDQDDDTMLADARFEPGETAYLFWPDFTREDLKAALFQSSHDNPKTLTIRLNLPEPIDASVETEMVVRRLDPIYIYETVEGRRQPCTPYPDWYIEGELVNETAYGPAGTVVRIYVIDGDKNEDYSDAYIQRIPESSDPNGVIERDEALR
jgi:hypothetical protein